MLEEQINHLKTNLIEYFRTKKNHSNWEMAHKIALNQIKRITTKDTEVIQQAFEYYAQKLKNNLTLASICSFANNCIKYSYTQGIFENEQSEFAISEQKSFKKIAFKSIESMIKKGVNPMYALNKTAKILYKKKIEDNTKKHKATILKAHPLSENIHMAKLITDKIPKEDVRNKLLSLGYTSRSKEGEILFNVLKKASAFCPHNLHKLLGDELFYLCKPVGFNDKNGNIVILEVNDNSALYALTYKKMDIINRLKNDINFKNLNNVRFKIKSEFIQG